VSTFDLSLRKEVRIDEAKEMDEFVFVAVVPRGREENDVGPHNCSWRAREADQIQDECDS
jgi:hypothetical protein